MRIRPRDNDLESLSKKRQRGREYATRRDRCAPTAALMPPSSAPHTHDSLIITSCRQKAMPIMRAKRFSRYECRRHATAGARCCHYYRRGQSRIITPLLPLAHRASGGRVLLHAPYHAARRRPARCLRRLKRGRKSPSRADDDVEARITILFEVTTSPTRGAALRHACMRKISCHDAILLLHIYHRTPPLRRHST